MAEYFKIEDCCEILDSQRIPITEKDRTPGVFPYYGANGVQDYIDDFIFDDELVLVAEDGGNFGSKTKPIAYRVSGKCWVNNHAHVLKAKDMIDTDYLCYSLMFYNVGSIVNGATRQKLNQKQLRQMKVPKREIKHQTSIVEQLNTIQKILENKKTQIYEYDQLIKSRFVEMFISSFHDKKCYRSIDEICKLIDYRGKTPEKSDNGIPLITAKNVKSNKFDIEPREYIPAENYDSVMTRGYPKINDVLFTTEAPLGNVCRIPDVYGKFCVGQRLITMQPKKGVLTSEYLEMALLSNEFQEEMWRQSSGSTVKGIRSKLLVKIQVPVPDYDLQMQFTAIVKQVDKLKLVIQESLIETQTLFDSLMQYYFG